ncbi:LPXTG cell wall anchor domain-containing protein [Enterococcus sp. LJL120]
MKKMVKLILFFMVSLLLSFGFAGRAHAETLPPGFLVGDDTGIQVGTEGEYFIVNNNITPGQTFSRTITLSNYSTDDGDFALKLVMNPNDEDHQPEMNGELNLLEVISVKLTYQGQVIYQGTIDGNGTPVANQRQQPIDLGTLEVGEVRNIQADFTVSSEYPDTSWREISKVDFYWLFFANREPGSTVTSTTPSLPPTGKLPQTGEDWRNVLLGMVAGFILIGIALIVLKKRKDEQQN